MQIHDDLKSTSFMARTMGHIKSLVDYCTVGVWNDARQNWKISTLKVLNLTVRSFLNSDLQSKSCAMTYRTLLAMVPALALICAIARGFGLQNMIMELLIKQFPSQQQALTTAFSFVDSYLSQASGGLFVGVGVVFLLWTIVSLIRSIETMFNDIWQIAKGRSIWRMTTDYLAIILLLPILMICSNGITIFMSTSLSNLLPFSFVKPAIETLFDVLGLVLTWLFFAGTYILVPNTKVRFRNAIVPGALVGTAFVVLQWLFMNGQLYVAKYNAIYGSFSFLPLFLIWMQLVWLFTLTGGVLCYAMQNIGEFNFGDNIKNISFSYRTRTTLVLMAIIAQRFKASLPALTLNKISVDYRLPLNLITPEAVRLKEMGLVNFIDCAGKETGDRAIQPAVDVTDLTVAEVINRLRNHGSSDFIPNFSDSYAEIDKIYSEFCNSTDTEVNEIRIIDISIDMVTK